jgi:carboxymethylenebutenolidase
MNRSLLLAAAFIMAAASTSIAQTTAPASHKAPPSATTATEQLSASPRHGEWASIPVPGTDRKIHTWIVYPERPDKAPVVLVIHEIFGMTDWVRAVTDQMAAEGFIAVAPDLLSGKGPNGGGTESFPGGGRSDMNSGATGGVSALTAEEDAQALDAVLAYAVAQPSATGKCGCIGFCWGGGTSFMYATSQPKLSGAVVCYGPPAKTEQMAKIACPVLGLYGGSDARISATVPGAIKDMADLKKSYDPHIFDGATHGFFRQQTSAPNAKAADEGWNLAIEFLKKNLEAK